MYDIAHKLFDYHESGNLIRKLQMGNRTNIGDIAGCKGNGKLGYKCVRFMGKGYYLHQIIYLYHHGYIPEWHIDHIDKNKHNNRIENLREVTPQCNHRNTINQKNNTSGVKGVYWNKKRNKWTSQIKVDQKTIPLGRYSDFDEAVLARLATEQCLNWDGCDSSSPAYQYAINHKLIKPTL